MRISLGFFGSILIVASVAYGNDPDGDGDGLSDFQEIHKHGTDPTRADSDGDGVPDGDWLERREYEYTVRSVVQVMKPVTVEYLTDDYQDARILDETETYVELEVIHYPFNTVDADIEGDSNWRRSAAKMKEWTAATPTSDWTPSFQRQIVADLKEDGIDIGELDDRSVVTEVSRWLLKRAVYNDSFTTYITAFDDRGRPYIPGDLKRGRDDAEFGDPWRRELSAVGMYENRQRGSCSSSAIYLSGCLRAVGIPTRTILCIPVVDANDEREMEMVKRRISNPEVRRHLMSALGSIKGSWASHTFNEVFVGGRWRRLNYDRLGQNSYDRKLFGLITHVATFRDWADARMPETIGRRQAGTQQALDTFGGPNPYSTISLRDEIGVHCKREFAPVEPIQAEVTKVEWTDSKELPADVLAGLAPRGRFGLVAFVEGLSDFDECQSFLAEADLRVFLEASDHTLKVGFDRGCVWWKDRTALVYVGFGQGDRRDLQTGVPYRVKLRNGNDEYRWRLRNEMIVVRE